MQTAVGKYENAQEKENSALAGYETEINSYIHGNRDVNLTDEVKQYIDQKNEWKLIGSAYGKDGLVSLEGYNISTLWIRFSQEITGNGTIVIPYIALTNTEEYYYTGRNNRNAQVKVTKNGVKLAYCGYDTTDATSTTTMYVYYK